jgi:hypothetical protein
MTNDPINFRPNQEDRAIIDKIKEFLSRVTKQEAFDTAAIRYALRYWFESLDD